MAAICEPTASNTSGPCPIGSRTSSSAFADSCGRRAAKSVRFVGSKASISFDASLRVNVLRNLRGAVSRTTSRWARSIVRIRSAPEAIFGVNCRAAKPETSPPSFSTTSAASLCTGWFITARVPALEKCNPAIPSCEL